MIRYFKLDDNIYKLIPITKLGESYSWYVFDSKIREWHFGSIVKKDHIPNIFKSFEPITEEEAFLEVL